MWHAIAVVRCDSDAVLLEAAYFVGGRLLHMTARLRLSKMVGPGEEFVAVGGLFSSQRPLFTSAVSLAPRSLLFPSHRHLIDGICQPSCYHSMNHDTSGLRSSPNSQLLSIPGSSHLHSFEIASWRLSDRLQRGP